MPTESVFEIDVVSPEILMEEINRYNHLHGTDFRMGWCPEKYAGLNLFGMIDCPKSNVK